MTSRLPKDRGAVMPSLKAAKLFCIRDCVRLLKGAENSDLVKNPLNSLDISAKEQLLTALKRLNATSMWKLYSCWLSGERHENELVSVLMRARVEKLLEKRGLFVRSTRGTPEPVTAAVSDEEETSNSAHSEDESHRLPVGHINDSQPTVRKANLKSFFVGSLGAAARAPKPPSSKKETPPARSKTPKRHSVQSRHKEDHHIPNSHHPRSAAPQPTAPAQNLHAAGRTNMPIEELHPSWAARVQSRATIQPAAKPQQHLTFD